MDYKKIIARVVRNWPAKVLSVVAAIFLFTFHRMHDLQERYFSVPLLLDINSNMAANSSYPQNVRIILRGTNSIFYLSETDIEARLDFTGYTEPGLYKAPVQIRRKGTAADVEILEITVDPAEISLELDRWMSKFVTIIPSFQGYLDTGYEMVSYSLEPNQAEIHGPMNLVLEITELRTNFINLEGRKADFDSRVRITIPNQLLSLQGDGMVEFRSFIKEHIIIKNFENLPISIKGLPDTLAAILDPSRALVRIQGVQSMLEGNRSELITPLLSVDCTGIHDVGLFELPLQVTIPDGLNIERRDPEIIRVVIQPKEEH
ncbi:MAG: hypothetical protein LBH07_07330 [Treponema sp.]|nr:hypothetical protein [Treponema sp.]